MIDPIIYRVTTRQRYVWVICFGILNETQLSTHRSFFHSNLLFHAFSHNVETSIWKRSLHYNFSLIKGYIPYHLKLQLKWNWWMIPHILQANINIFFIDLCSNHFYRINYKYFFYNLIYIYIYISQEVFINTFWFF